MQFVSEIKAKLLFDSFLVEYRCLFIFRRLYFSQIMIVNFATPRALYKFLGRVQYGMNVLVVCLLYRSFQ